MALIPPKSNHYLEWGPWAIGRPLQAESGEEERYGPALRDRDVEGAVRRAPHPVGVAGAKDSPVLPVVSSVAAWEIMSRDEFACTNKKYSNNQTKQEKLVVWLHIGFTFWSSSHLGWCFWIDETPQSIDQCVKFHALFDKIC